MAHLFRFRYFADRGYVVYRHCFDEQRCNLIDGIRAHRVADFITEEEARDYVMHRNRLLDELGTTELPHAQS